MRELIAEVLSVPMVNFTSAYKHVPKINQQFRVVK